LGKYLLHTGKFDTEACQYWDKFYKMHQEKFFKDRKWLFLEFPELLPSGAKSQTTNGRLGDQQASLPQPTGSSTDTETRHRQHNGLTHHHRNADAPNHQTESGQGAAPDRNEAAIQAATFPGQHASFRILEVFKTVHMYPCGPLTLFTYCFCNVLSICFSRKAFIQFLAISKGEILASVKGKVQLHSICNQPKVVKLSVLFHRETDAYLYCCDFSPCAIQLVKVSFANFAKVRLSRCCRPATELVKETHILTKDLLKMRPPRC
ncbi:tRNA N(3)-cytidine methyltransferase METTL8, mitochondrial-like, partial [Anarhichas minor]|uniref:tRNA N(3)-cytidine methyltransferase METTL8, mitochondrial-like n=1 Tax=Anarhichas minor TaxID=65739 RepID=UPI003F73D757